MGQKGALTQKNSSVVKYAINLTESVWREFSWPSAIFYVNLFFARCSGSYAKSSRNTLLVLANLFTGI